MAKRFTADELEEFISHLKEGFNFSEACELIGRDRTTVRRKLVESGRMSQANEIYSQFRKASGRQRVSRKRSADGKGRFDDLIEEVKRITAPAPEPRPIPPVRRGSLDDFTPREIIKYLYGLGYRIENNKLFLYTREEVNLHSVINE